MTSHHVIQIRRFAVLLGSLLAFAFSGGCGGAASVATIGSASPKLGSAVFNVNWPSSRVPIGTVQIDVYATTTAHYQINKITMKIPQHTGVMDGIPVGAVVFEAVGSDKNGKQTATAVQTVDIVMGQNDVTLILR